MGVVVARWAERPWLDWVIGAAAVGAWRGLRAADIVGPLDLAEPSARAAVYEQAGVLGGAIVGLFIIPVSLVLALAPADRLRRVVDRKQGQIRRTVVHAGVAAVVLIAFAFVGSVLDATPTGNRAVRFVAPCVVAVAALSVARILRMLGALLTLQEVDRRPSLADRLKPVEFKRSA